MAFFAWLEFLTLLNDLASHVDSSYPVENSPFSVYDWRQLSSRKEARRNLVRVNDFFLMSFVSFAVSVVAEYLYHNAFYIGGYFVGTLYHSFFLYVVFMSLFPTGIVTFCVPIKYIREILRGDRSLVNIPQNVSSIVGLLFILAFMFIVAWLGYAIYPFQYSYVVWSAAYCLTILGVIRTLKKKTRHTGYLLFAPFELLGIVIIAILIMTIFAIQHLLQPHLLRGG